MPTRRSPSTPTIEARDRRQAHSATTSDDGRRPRPLVARHRRPPVRRLPAGPGRLRAHALPALHLGHDRQAQGHHAHDRRLPPRDVVQPRGGLRHQARRRVLVRRRHRLGDRPQLHRLRPARQRDDRGPVRGRPRHAGLGPLVADRRGLQGHDPVLRADRHPRVHEAGRGAARRRTTSRRCALLGSVGEPINPEAWLWYREHIGGEQGARSSTRGGRPRPGRS